MTDRFTGSVSSDMCLTALAVCFLAAPDEDEKKAIGDALVFACMRLQVSRDAVIESVKAAVEAERTA